MREVKAWVRDGADGAGAGVMDVGVGNGIVSAAVGPETDQILGATLLCAEAHELANLIKMAIDNDIPASYLRSQNFTHPTIAEGLNDLFA